MAKQRNKDFDNKILGIRLGLTAILAFAFLLIFFLCGGAYLLFNKMGEVKCFSGNDFEVHFIDVGQGDSAFIRFPDNTNLLIDAGPYSQRNNLCNYLKDLFKQENISQIDNFLITHQDSDHVGGAQAIFENFDVKCFYRPKVYSNYEIENFGNPEDYAISQSATYNYCITSAYNESCSIRFSCSDINWGNNQYSVKFLSPNEDKYSNSNSYSAVVKITYRDRSFLFTGDANSVTENEIIKKYPHELDVDVLKVAHHGAKSDTFSNFLTYVKPDRAVISVGKNNSYGHPASQIIQTLENINCKVYQTSLVGSVAMSVDGQGNILVGGKSNSPIIDVTIVIGVFVIGILIVWGVKPADKKKTKKKKSKSR